MDVRCERCRAEHAFDDAQVTAAGLRVHCTRCGHLLLVKKAPPAPPPAAPGPVAPTLWYAPPTPRPPVLPRPVGPAEEVPLTGEFAPAHTAELSLEERNAVRPPRRLGRALVALALVAAAAAGGLHLATRERAPRAAAPELELPKERPARPARPPEPPPQERVAVAVPLTIELPASEVTPPPPPPPQTQPATSTPPQLSLEAELAQAHRLRETGRPASIERALNIYGRIAAEDPENVEALVGRGLCYLDLEQYRPAEASFQAALEVEPEDADALMGLAETYSGQGKTVEAIQYYERYLARHPAGEEANVARNALDQLRR